MNVITFSDFVKEICNCDNLSIDEMIIKSLQFDKTDYLNFVLVWNLNSKRDLSMRACIPYCKSVEQVKIILNHSNRELRRVHNNLLIETENLEILTFLCEKCNLNPGYKKSLPLYNSVINKCFDKMHLFLKSYRCDIYTIHDNKTILEHALDSKSFKIQKEITYYFDDFVAIEALEPNDFERIREKVRKIKNMMCREQWRAKQKIRKQLKKGTSFDQIMLQSSSSGLLDKVSNHLCNKSAKNSYFKKYLYFQMASPSSSLMV